MAREEVEGLETKPAGQRGEPETSPLGAATDQAPRWGLGDAAAGAVVAFLASGLLASLWVAIVGGDVEGLGALAASQIGLWIGLVGAPLLASRAKGSGSAAADFGLRARPADAVGLPVGVACQLVVVPVLYLLIQLFTGKLDVEGPARELTDGAHGAQWVLLALLIVIGAPVAEELFFRGLLLRAAERRWGTGWALAVSSVAFAASHFQFVQFPGLALAGLVFGVLVLTTGRLGTSMAAHMAFNAAAFVGLVLL